jgi:HMG (high mobility group) box
MLRPHIHTRSARRSLLSVRCSPLAAHDQTRKMFAAQSKSFNAILLATANEALDLLVKEVNALPEDAELDIEKVAEKVKAMIKETTMAATKATGKAAAAAAKPAKDKDAPKRGLTSYMFYSNEVRDKVRSEFPELKMTEVSKKISEMWNELSDAKKAKYVDMAANDKARYERENAAYKKA